MIETAQKPPWTGVFAEIALRALVRLHYEYLAWSEEQGAQVGGSRSILDGPGLAYADELTVCGEIAQEFLSSRWPHGRWVEGQPTWGIDEGKRYYVLRREQLLPDSQKRCDLFVNRVDESAKEGEYGGVFIEAKRRFVWTTHLDGTHDRSDQLRGIREDIAKLKEHIDPGDGGPEAERGYIFVWNIAKRGEVTWETPEKFCSHFNDVKVWQTRAWPLAASQDGTQSLSVDAVNTWLWTVLAEVTPIRGNDPGAT